MAVLAELDRVAVFAELMRRESADRQAMAGMLKADLRAAVDATDTWIDDNAATFNAALPLPARTALTARQKKLLFMMVAMRRFGVEV